MSKYYFNPFKFLRAVSLFQNLGYFPEIEGQRLQRSHWLLLLPMIVRAMLQGFSKIEGRPLILENHHQQDDQDKKPMIDTKIIYMGN